MSSDLRATFLADLRASRLLGILRNAPDDSLSALAEVVKESGLAFLEVTMNTPGAVGQILSLRKALDGFCQIGAGTVLTHAEAQAAYDAGAAFLVSPCFSRQVQDFADDRDLPTLPGAFTPQEIWQAHNLGATMVKLFPAKSAGGPAYLKELRGPFHDIPLLACGGVNANTAGEYLAAGADALAFGGSVFAPSRLASGEFERVLTDLLALRSATLPH